MLNVEPLPVPAIPIAIHLDGKSITASFMGGAPGLAAGTTQINIPLPASGYTNKAASVSVSNNYLGVAYLSL